MIYFHGNKDVIKIGWSKEPTSRRIVGGAANTNHQFLCAIVGDRPEEKRLHGYFKEFQYRQETGSGTELYHNRGSLRDYVEWIQEQPWVAVGLEDLKMMWPDPHQFPWNMNGDGAQRTDGQSLLPGFGRIRAEIPLPIRRRDVRFAYMGQGGNDEYYTPTIYIVAARRALGGIDLDPASSPLANLTVQANAIFTKTKSGLDYSWNGRVWLNPPYSLMEEFVAKLLEECRAGRVQEAILCANANGMETRWYDTLWRYPFNAQCIPTRRPDFKAGQDVHENANSSSSKNTAFIYIGHGRQNEFVREFRRFGRVMERWHEPTVSKEEYAALCLDGKDWNISDDDPFWDR